MWLDHLRVDFDEDDRWIVLYRGDLAIACNLNAEPVTIGISGDLVLASSTPEARPDGTVLAGHSFAILRLVNSASAAGPG